MSRRAIYDEVGFWSHLKNGGVVNHKEFVWINICNPNEPINLIQSSHLDKYPNIRIPFWDITCPLSYRDETIYPPTIEDARKIIALIKQFQDKSFIVNCEAGISRSGAVAQFLEDMGWYWPFYFKQLSHPNSTLLKHLKEQWLKWELWKDLI